MRTTEHPVSSCLPIGESLPMMKPSLDGIYHCLRRLAEEAEALGEDQLADAILDAMDIAQELLGSGNLEEAKAGVMSR